MRAVVYEEFGGRAEVREVADPVAPPDGVVIRVEATGMCRSDWHGWMGHDADITVLPHVPGHELAGVVDSAGPGVSRWRAGDRVMVPFICACGSCRECTTGNQQVCERQTQPGFTHWGSFAEPGYLPRLVAAIDGLGCDFVRVDHVQVEGRRRETHRAPQPRRGVVLDPRDGILPADFKTMVDYPYAWAGIYRRELDDLLTFPTGLHTAEDRPWIWRLHRLARSYAVVSLAGVFYRRGLAASLTQIGDERQLHFFDAYDIVLDEAEPRYLPKAARNLCALLAHHVELADRFTPALRARFDERARAALARLPHETLSESLGGLEPERAALLDPYLPGGPRA